MVRVECMTYNHAPYIEDAMNGFCMQETDFPFVCVIVDDASTDGEPEVIKQYLKNNFDLQDDQCFREEYTDDYHLIFAQHKTNRNCYFGVLLLKYNHWGKKAKAPYYEKWSKAKYIALCEGDDYWTHPKKLQMQVNALIEHPECSFSSSGFTIMRPENNTECIVPTQNTLEIFDIQAWEKLGVTQTLTLLFSHSAYDVYLSEISKYKRPKDTHLCYHLFKQGKCAYISMSTGVYNFTGLGIWSSYTYEQQMEEYLNTRRDIYLKNGKDTIVYPRYFDSLKKSINYTSIGKKKYKLLVEGIREARGFTDNLFILKKTFLFMVNIPIIFLRCRLAIRTRWKALTKTLHNKS